jgi:hypothetical protein
MPVTSHEAEASLRAIARAARRSEGAQVAALTSPHLILWGVVWALGYGNSSVGPRFEFAWAILGGVGMIGSGLVGWWQRRFQIGPYDWRPIASVLAVLAFVIATFAVIRPLSPAQTGAFFPLIAALYYVLAGLWARAVRIAVLGFAVAALTLAGFFWLPQFFTLWMAGVGGCALILGGLWLRAV